MSALMAIGFGINWLMLVIGLTSPFIALWTALSIDEYPQSRALKSVIPCLVVGLGAGAVGNALTRWLAPDFSLMRALPLIVAVEFGAVILGLGWYWLWRMWPSREEYDAALFRGEVRPMQFKLTYRWPFYEVIDEGYGAFKFCKGKRGLYRVQAGKGGSCHSDQSEVTPD